ncbi:MAG: hypothetical protein K0Q87_1602 [Neobacillus sp.]|nr:hypothetical protein [Neobacillus sp.]
MSLTESEHIQLSGIIEFLKSDLSVEAPLLSAGARAAAVVAANKRIYSASFTEWR